MRNPSNTLDLLEPHDRFVDRHVGPRPADILEMLGVLGLESLDDLTARAVPDAIRFDGDLNLAPPRTEAEILADLRAVAALNRPFRNYIGLGYHECVTPAVIQRKILENPAWYTAYTPYQPEISQGRLEALLNFQTMVADLTGMDLANASLLDEGTAAAEAMTLCHRIVAGDRDVFLVSDRCHPQTIEVVRGRATPLGIEVRVADHERFEFDTSVFGALVQYPATDGAIVDYTGLVERAHGGGALVVVAADLLALTLLRSPGELGADVAVGSSQRFGVPMGFGGPHAAYMATRDAYKRQLPGRIVGLSKDARGNPAIRLALQTREQHIRRDKATSNICTAQVLLAVIASMYAVYHGPEGLRRIASRIRVLTEILARALRELGYGVGPEPRFDTLRVTPGPRPFGEIIEAAEKLGINLRSWDDGTVGIALGETTGIADLQDLFVAFGGEPGDLNRVAIARLAAGFDPEFSGPLKRTTPYLTHPVFQRYRSETDLQRYIHRLESRDLSLVHAMIPLGSCTMKLNAAAEMQPISFPGFASPHPFAPVRQVPGYRRLISNLEDQIRAITGFAGVSMMPNAGAQGEYAGLRVIQAYHEARGDRERRVCVIPHSAHGTNPASAILAGMEVVVVGTDSHGNIDVADLRAKVEAHSARLGALMVTYPSTHGVFEEGIREICGLIHAHGGQVYLDGANLNALVGVCRPADIGADVCHLNLHKTFCIPHGGGGPGMGPIAVAAHLVPYLPGHPFAEVGGAEGIRPIAAAPWGSAGILPIPFAYISMMGGSGLRYATQVAVLNANYIARRLHGHFELLYSGRDGLVAHECILDMRPFRELGIEAEDVAKRLMDYGFHAPTMSWPVAGTLMVEPTESEPKEELDRFVEAMLGIREEIREIERGQADPRDNVLKNAPHTADAVTADDWTHPYSREKAAFPTAFTRKGKFWPAVARIDNAYGDRHLVCSCPPVDAYAESV